MFLSKLNAAALVLCALAMTGCWKPSKKDDPHNGKSESDATASFHVRSVECEAVTPKVENKVWKIADHKEIFARACIRDRKANLDVLGNNFSVEILEQPGVKLTGFVTNDTGCFQWKEKIPYNQFAEKTGFIEVVRRVRAEGVHVGYRDIRIAINPWAGERGFDRQKACKFLKTDAISDTQRLDVHEVMNDKGGAARLWMSDVSPLVTLVDESDAKLRKEMAKLVEQRSKKDVAENKMFVGENGALLEVFLNMKPQMMVQDASGNPIELDLRSGRFHVWAQLIANNVGESRDQTFLLTPNLIPSEGKIVGGRLVTTLRMGLSHRITRGRLEIAIKVVPIGLNVDVKPFEGLYVIGDIENLIGASRPALSNLVYENEEGFHYDAYVQKAANYAQMAKAQEGVKYQPFIFETATVMFAGVRPGETATTRTIEYKVQSCVRDSLTGRRVQHQKFQIFDEFGKEILITQPDGSKITPSTNQEGCLVWTSSLTHKYYKPEEFFFPEFKIVHARLGKDNAHLKQLVVNPWDAMFRTFGFDRIEFPQEFIDSVRNREKIQSRIFVPRYSYHAIRFRYDIDRYMDLEVRKEILLNLRPEVLRYSGIIGGRRVSEPLRDGFYLMKVAIQKDYLDPADSNGALMPGVNERGEMTTVARKRGDYATRQFITVVKKIVRVNSGEINTPVEFSVRDLRLMRIRSQFLVQLEPLDEQKLTIARILNDKHKQEIAAADKSRGMTDEVERQKVLKQMKDEYRGKREQITLDLSAKLKNTRTGLLNTDKLLSLNDAELAEFDFSKEMAQRLADDLKLNDFTVQSASPVVDLNLLVEKEEESGLEARSFVGPIIFLSNAYGDDLRPTNNLDEKFCDVSDCDEFKSRVAEERLVPSKYDSSPYFGSVKHLIAKQVDDLIHAHTKIQSDRKLLMPALASVGNFVTLYNMKFITLGSEKISNIKVNCDGPPLDCFQPAPEYQLDADGFLGFLNDKSSDLGNLSASSWRPLASNDAKAVDGRREILKSATRDDLKLLAKGQIPSLSMTDRLCRHYSSKIAGAIKDPHIGSNVGTGIYQACLRKALSARNEKESPLFIDHKVRVYETGDYIFQGGKQLNVNVGSQFGLNHSTSFGYSAGAGFDFFDIPMFGVAAPFAKPFSLKLGLGAGDGRQRSDGTSVAESTYLVMQAASFAIDLKEYEHCSIVGIHHELLGVGFAGLMAHVKTDEERVKIENAKAERLFICSGERENTPLQVKESYYYFTQHFTEGDMLDQADLYNHPWLLAMRGARDFAAFAKWIRWKDVSIYYGLGQIGQAVVEKPGWPLDKMVEAYKKVSPTFPGIYTVLRDGEALDGFPFDKDPASIFKKEAEAKAAASANRP